ncbi:exodeoxyribonuclease V subunit alpha [Cellulomonas fengjieae]|uniref:RecBCD enzyme subunit RecD n=1 Tax=Cellulomonas fengjieae TaxID=2819978 RepID=A0ABS3SG38_9CELL|nr:exodeoxyribonuclease V subunit alpha [Cellulomonas fengjieae]MBO3084716.1 exodeoxyribonuclease V subunit alpha [Cellulomonas fengjieae]QVI66962.1 exodeoxyribonuclease V subunit alpha [Cellulomonas fengjieae]
MTVADDPYAASVPWRVTGLLADADLTAADVHVARRLGAIGGDDDERVLLAAALAVQALRAGSVCVVLDETSVPQPDGWHDAIRRSPLVADGPDGPADRPLRWVDGRLYLDRYWRDEQTVREAMHDRLARTAAADPVALTSAVDRLYPSATDAAQREALRTAATSHLMVLTGGPGTGKTTTVARLVAALQAAAGPGLRVALAAPTGKAAARLQESVNAEVALLGPADVDAVGSLRATTLHRLLGWRPGTTTRFRHDRLRRLPHDVVVVDESSMVSLPLMARLVEALRPTARLVLVGDPDQLASVEAGAVLGDLVAALPRGVVRLTQAHRYGPALGALAEAIRLGDAETAVALLRSGDAHRSWVEPAAERLSPQDVAGLRADVEAGADALVAAARAGDAPAALRALGSHRLLLAHREGPFGVAHWAATAESWIGTGAGQWPLGRPLLVTQNDRASGLYNGDTGVVVADGTGGVAVAFGEPDDPRLVRPYRLPAVQPVHAMTVHRGQGSQFARVTLLLPPATSPLLSRELLYTAVTRAREHVRVIGTEDAIRAAIERPVRRASGLREAR